MKAIYTAGQSRSGFITATVVPSRRRDEPRFGLLDGVLLLGLLGGIGAIVRLVLAT